MPVGGFVEICAPSLKSGENRAQKDYLFTNLIETCKIVKQFEYFQNKNRVDDPSVCSCKPLFTEANWCGFLNIKS